MQKKSILRDYADAILTEYYTSIKKTGVILYNGKKKDYYYLH